MIGNFCFWIEDIKELMDMEKHPFTLIHLIYLLLSFNKSVIVLWIKSKYTTIVCKRMSWEESKNIIYMQISPIDLDGIWVFCQTGIL